jgi:hypothetical protein
VVHCNKVSPLHCACVELPPFLNTINRRANTERDASSDATAAYVAGPSLLFLKSTVATQASPLLPRPPFLSVFDFPAPQATNSEGATSSLSSYLSASTPRFWFAAFICLKCRQRHALLTCLSCKTMPILISKKRGKVMRSLLNTIADVKAIRRLLADFRWWKHSCCLDCRRVRLPSFAAVPLMTPPGRLNPPGAMHCRVTKNAGDAPN